MASERSEEDEPQSKFVKKKCVGHVPTLRESGDRQRIIVYSEREWLPIWFCAVYIYGSEDHVIASVM